MYGEDLFFAASAPQGESIAGSRDALMLPFESPATAPAPAPAVDSPRGLKRKREDEDEAGPTWHCYGIAWGGFLVLDGCKVGGVLQQHWAAVIHSLPNSIYTLSNVRVYMPDDCVAMIKPTGFVQMWGNRRVDDTPSDCRAAFRRLAKWIRAFRDAEGNAPFAGLQLGDVKPASARYLIRMNVTLNIAKLSQVLRRSAKAEGASISELQTVESGCILRMPWGTVSVFESGMIRVNLSFRGRGHDEITDEMRAYVTGVLLPLCKQCSRDAYLTYHAR